LPREPPAERRASESGEVARPVDAEDLLEEGPVGAERAEPVRERRHGRAEAPDQLRVPEDPVPAREAATLVGLDGAGPQPEPGEVDGPAMGRRVGTVVEAELALVAEVYHSPNGVGRERLGVAIDVLAVEGGHQVPERRAERQAAAAAATDVVDAPELPVDGR